MAFSRGAVVRSEGLGGWGRRGGEDHRPGLARFSMVQMRKRNPQDGVRRCRSEGGGLRQGGLLEAQWKSFSWRGSKAHRVVKVPVQLLPFLT